jgi:hypothetical protein
MSVQQEEVRLSRETREKDKLDMEGLSKIRRMFLRLAILVGLVEERLD